jgi:hypothetical protein
MYDAGKCLKSQLHSISGFNSGLQVRVLPGSPRDSKSIHSVDEDSAAANCGDFFTFKSSGRAATCKLAWAFNAQVIGDDN